MTYRYEPIDAALLDESNGHLLFQNVTDHYLARAGNNYGNVDNVENVPPTVRVVWCLWVFLAEVGGGGINDYLWNHCQKLHDLKEVYAALVKVKATEMLDLLETGIRIAFEERCGEFLNDAGALEWAEQFQKKVPLDSAGLDSRSREIAHPKTSEIIAKFIRTNRANF